MTQDEWKDKQEHDNAVEKAMQTIHAFFESLGFEDVQTWRHKLADAKLEDARRRAEIGRYDA